MRAGIDPDHEANTSRYVHEILLHCLGWPFERILPQSESRGFIDYKLAFTRPVVEVHLEVKRFAQELSEQMIRKYIVRRGPMPEGFQVGVLTNLQDWQIFVAGPSVREATGASMALILWHDIETRSDIAAIDALIGFRRNGHLRELRAALGDSEEIVMGLLLRSDAVLTAFRAELGHLRNKNRPEARLPQRIACREQLSLLLEGEWDESFPLSIARFRQAVRSATVATAVDEEIGRLFGARSRVASIRRTISEVLAVAEEDSLD